MKTLEQEEGCCELWGRSCNAEELIGEYVTD